MAGKARVHELARELNITSKDVLAMLTGLGEFVQSASSVVEAPVADKLRQRCGRGGLPRSTPGGRSRSVRDYRRNDPYQDLGKTEIDHLQAADRPVCHYDDHRPNPFGVAPRPSAVASPTPRRDVVAPLPLVPTRPQRREWYRGEEPSSLTKYLLDHKIVKSGFPNYDPSELAVQLRQAGVEPHELNHWTYDDVISALSTCAY